MLIHKVRMNIVIQCSTLCVSQNKFEVRSVWYSDTSMISRHFEFAKGNDLGS